MNTLSAHPSAGQAPHIITPNSLAQLGLRFGIEYRSEDWCAGAAPVAQDRIHDVSLSPSRHPTLSDLQVEHTIEYCYFDAERGITTSVHYRL